MNVLIGYSLLFGLMFFTYKHFRKHPGNAFAHAKTMYYRIQALFPACLIVALAQPVFQFFEIEFSAFTGLCVVGFYFSMRLASLRILWGAVFLLSIFWSCYGLSHEWPACVWATGVAILASLLSDLGLNNRLKKQNIILPGDSQE